MHGKRAEGEERHTKHDGTRAVIGIQEGDANMVSWFQFEKGGCLEGQRLLGASNEPAG